MMTFVATILKIQDFRSSLETKVCVSIRVEFVASVLRLCLNFSIKNKVKILCINSTVLLLHKPPPSEDIVKKLLDGCLPKLPFNSQRLSISRTENNIYWEAITFRTTRPDLGSMLTRFPETVLFQVFFIHLRNIECWLICEI
jgi:hypothetical protein